ncbi:FecR domain-containing protein [Olivibacter sp. CPCC 100613]|uniref:FecR family protein n=1 Tax=Olivibacter sp. CPCC 100613 TaxID=3079931 RepID=UPI002FF4D483
MQADQFRKLLQRYRTKKGTSKEDQLVDDWYNSFDDTFAPDSQQRKTLRNELHTRIQQQLFPSESSATQKINRILFQRLAIAALVLVFIGIGFWQFTNRRTEKALMAENQWVEIVAEQGRLKQIKLPDSSELWLNAGTKIRFTKPFTGKSKREVTVVEGEVFFTITPNPAKPFIVHTHHIDTRVLGTSFTVHAYNELNELRVSVATGMVQVQHADGRLLGTLGKGEEVIYNKAGDTSLVQKVDPEIRSAWKSGTTYLSEVTFAELALVFHNTYGLHLKTGSSMIANQHYSIQLDRRTRHDDFVKALCAIHKNRYRKEGDAIVIY